MKNRLITLALSVIILSWNVQAESLERLLTTPQQRAQIDTERWQAKNPQAAVSQSTDAPTLQRKLIFEALLKTEQGYSIWINGQLIERKQRLYGISIDPSQVRLGVLPLKTPSGNRRLALGQVYWIDQDKVLEPYEKP